MQEATKGKNLLNFDLLFEKAQIGENMKVADLGCGASGIVVFRCAGLVGKKGRVYAVDILKKILEAIDRKAGQESLQNITSVWSDLEVFSATRIESGSLDVAFLVNTLFQSQKKAQIIREAARMLKRDGRLLVVDWKSIAIPFGPSPEERVKLKPLKEGARKLGLKLDTEFEAGPYHYGIIFTKV